MDQSGSRPPHSSKHACRCIMTGATSNTAFAFSPTAKMSNLEYARENIGNRQVFSTQRKLNSLINESFQMIVVIQRL